MTLHSMADKTFRTLLHANGSDPVYADKLSLYGWLIGSWDMDIVRQLADGTSSEGRGEIHFGWVLGGRAIQDIWVSPRFDSGQPPQMFGTTLRIYDPGIDAWHILWSDPAKQYYSQQFGRPKGRNIVQIGTDIAGQHVRWSFTNIQPDSFLWIGERSLDEGETWRTEIEFHANRAAG